MNGRERIRRGMVHNEQLHSLKKIEGQVRGIQRMIESEQYCVDILIQIDAVVGGLRRVEEKILKKHVEGCVARALESGSEMQRREKIDEMLRAIHRMRKS